MLAFDHDPRRQVLQLNGTRCFIDLLATRAGASKEGLGDFMFGDLAPGWQCFLTSSCCGGEGACRETLLDNSSEESPWREHHVIVVIGRW
jgi:hypothetical protein